MGVKFSAIVSRELQLGGCEFEQGAIAVPAGATVSAGTVLKRDGERRFAEAEAGDAFIAVVPFDMTNNGAATASLGFRAIVSGRVRRDMLSVGGASPITSAQADNLRANGNIIAVETADISRANP